MSWLFAGAARRRDDLAPQHFDIDALAAARFCRFTDDAGALRQKYVSEAAASALIGHTRQHLMPPTWRAARQAIFFHRRASMPPRCEMRAMTS